MKALGIGAITLVLLVIGFFWMLRQAFGPIERSGELELSDELTLQYQEMYNADFADVFYDVTFELPNSKGELFEIGRATFNNENWESEVQFVESNNCLIFIVQDIGSLAKVIVVNPERTFSIERTFDPQKLRDDPIWQAGNFENPVHLYYGSSSVTSVSNDSIQVDFEYRTGYNEPIIFWNQKLNYRLETAPLRILTTKAYQPTEK
ncbi:hypothetical protein [Marivirga arenosa]|uniref:Uncharacterized protein n=1 Tax=Marivirga arenosa TaxID=3059076 RepID=A0AA51ZVY6_9BACT|nr:hypothetical protein [Marivirga sp. BKB1-2]WNB17763.1 hypothetical protein QYS47_34895 [Marivirga sp. BKB1-2]